MRSRWCGVALRHVLISAAFAFIGVSISTPTLAAPDAGFDRRPANGGTTHGAPSFAQSWDQLTPEQRDRARRNFDAYRKLPPDRQKDVDRSFDRWQSMGSGEKARVRRNYDSFRQMSPDQRRDFGRRYQLYKRDHQR